MNKRLTDEQLQEIHGLMLKGLCTKCGGKGMTRNPHPATCDACGGTGLFALATDTMEEIIAELRLLRSQALTAEEREAVQLLADRNRCAMHGTRCTDVLCAETQAGVSVLDRLLAGGEG